MASLIISKTFHSNLSSTSAKLTFLSLSSFLQSTNKSIQMTNMCGSLSFLVLITTIFHQAQVNAESVDCPDIATGDCECDATLCDLKLGYNSNVSIHTIFNLCIDYNM